MSDLSESLAALSKRAGIAERQRRMEKFRADFKTVWRWYRSAGLLSQVEYENELAEAGLWVKERMKDEERISPVIEAYRARATQIEREAERAKQIAAEVRAERKAA